MAKPFDVVAYTYRADIYCPTCVVEMTHYSPNGNPADRKITNAEPYLDVVARIRGINRENEHSFDSDEFPKVVFRDSVNDDPDARPEVCGKCGERIED
jgi:hypothetical protein